MSTFDSLWSRAAAVMDAVVDATVGDRLRYRRGGVWLGEGDPPTIAGFVLTETMPIGMDELDSSVGARKRVKVSAAIIGEPLRSDRIEHPNLGPGLYQPGGDTPDNDGRYWIFDVQKAST